MIQAQICTFGDFPMTDFVLFIPKVTAKTNRCIHRINTLLEYDTVIVYASAHFRHPTVFKTD